MTILSASAAAIIKDALVALQRVTSLIPLTTRCRMAKPLPLPLLFLRAVYSLSARKEKGERCPSHAAALIYPSCAFIV